MNSRTIYTFLRVILLVWMNNMKHLCTKIILAMLMSMMGIQAFAHDIAVRNADGVTIYYSGNLDKTELTVSYRGSSYDSFSNEYSGNVTIPESVVYEGKTYRVTSIGNETFRVCSGLTSVTIPNSVTSIGGSAFYGCSSLISVTIPNSVTSIGGSAFYGCSSLTSISIPNFVTSIGNNAFYNCSGLISIVVEGGNAVYDSRNNCNAIIKTSTNELIAGCNNTTIPNSVTSIGDYAFYNCSRLTSVTIPNSVTSIGGSAFYGCYGLTSVTIPNSVTSIGGYTFYGCYGLTSVTIPNSVTSIGYEAFYNCRGLTSVTIPNSVTNIGGSAFYGCYGLTSVTIPNSVTSIGGSAFYGCSSLISVTIPNSVTSIGYEAFYNCRGLTSVTIGNSVTSIGERAFWNCSGLKEVHSLIEQPFAINGFGYYDYWNMEVKFPSATLYVPAGTKAKYQATNGWKNFKNIVEEDISSYNVTLTAKNYTREYGEENPTFGYDVNSGSIASGQPTFSCPATKTSPVGTYDIVIQKGTVSNGTVNLVKGTLTITKAPLTISAGNYSKKEGEDNPEFTLSYTGFKNGETKNVLTKLPTVNCSATKNSPAGNYTVSVSGAEAQNYEITYQNGTLTVTDTNSTSPSIVDLVNNGDMEGTDVSSFFYRFQGGDVIPAVITNGVGVNGSRGVKVAAAARKTDDYENQFFFRLNKPVYPGTKFRVSFDYRADKRAMVRSEAHSELGDYINWTEFRGNDYFTQEWKNFYYEGTVSSFNSTDEKPLHSIAFSLSLMEEANNYYFDNIKFEVETDNTENPDDDNITFADANVKALCVANWDTNKDGELSKDEAAAVTNIGAVFQRNDNIASFDELQFFIGIKTIREEAFFECKNLRSITLPSSIEIIEGKAFSSCYELRSLTIPRSVMGVGEQIVSYCHSLASIKVEDGNSVYDSRNNCNAIIESKTNTLIAGCKNTMIPNDVTKIGDGAFISCGFTTITIPNSVTSIGSDAFQGCALESITIPSSVTSISKDAFSYCSMNSIIVESGNIYYDSRDNCNAIIETRSNKLIEGCENTVIPNTVTIIGSKAFVDLGFTSIAIPNSVTSIGEQAFCQCILLQSITIPNSVKSIEDRAFYRCYSLQEINSLIVDPFPIFDVFDKYTPTLYVPIGTKAKYQAMEGWKYFSTIEEKGGSVPANNITFADTNVKAICVANWDTNKDGELSKEEAATVTDLGEVFRGNRDIQSFDELQYFTGLTTIGEHAFHDCRGLTSITLPNSVTTIGFGAFWYCESLTSLVIPGSVETINQSAIFVCRSLTSITIPKSVTSIGIQNLNYCNNLTTVKVESGNTVYDSRNNCNAIIETKTNTLVAGCKGTTIPSTVTAIGRIAFQGSDLTTITIPNSVTSIGASCFLACKKLTTITIPSSVTTLGGTLFYGCEVLSTIKVESGNTVYDSRDNCNAIIEKNTNTLVAGCKNTIIPSTVTSIGANAFRSCYGLTSITIPNSVKSIEEGAFQDCTGLKEVHSLIEKPFAIEPSVFQYDDNGETKFTSAVLYVPAGTKSKYQTTDGWKNFTNIVEWGGETPVVDNITFADATVKAICIENWDMNGDGELSRDEAAAVKNLGVMFQNHTDILSLDDLQNFTGLTTIGEEAFRGCRGLTSITIPNSVTTIGSGAFADCSGLTTVSIGSSVTTIENDAFLQTNILSLIWNSKTRLTQTMIDAFKENRSNLLIYVTDESVLPQSGMNNVVVSGTAQNIALKENSPFYSAQEFIAKNISFDHNFQMESGKGYAAGWESITLPFDVTKIVHESKGELVPFAKYSAGSNSKPFWLSELTGNGFKRAQGIEANKPYIVCMPNHSAYSSEYCLNGRVIFSGTNVVVKKTDETNMITVSYNGMTFRPTYQQQSKDNTVYPINAVSDYTTETGYQTAGSIFIRNLRDVRPFEAYFKTASASVRAFVALDFVDEAVTGLEEVLYGIKSNSVDGIRIYSISGQLVRTSKAKTVSEATKGLPAGVYVVNGKKMIVTL